MYLVGHVFIAKQQPFHQSFNIYTMFLEYRVGLMLANMGRDIKLTHTLLPMPLVRHFLRRSGNHTAFQSYLTEISLAWGRSLDLHLILPATSPTFVSRLASVLGVPDIVFLMADLV